MVYGRCQRDTRLCCRFQADRGTPLLGGGSCCHSKLSYGTGLLRLLSVTGRCRLAVTSPTPSRIRKRLRTATELEVGRYPASMLESRRIRGTGPLYRWIGRLGGDVVTRSTELYSA